METMEAALRSTFDLSHGSETVIHSGHFMVSHVHDTSLDEDDGGYDFAEACQDVQQDYQFGGRTPSSIAIEHSLAKLFNDMRFSYAGHIVSPKWKNFKGTTLVLKDKIRINNVIWRDWHIQFVKGKTSRFCKFVSPLMDDVHTKPQAIIVEGMYWKRKTKNVASEYKKFREYQKVMIRNKDTKKSLPVSGQKIPLLVPQVDPEQSTSGDQKFPLLSSSPQPMDWIDFDDELLHNLEQPLVFPNPKDFLHIGNADMIQPGLIQFQPDVLAVDMMEIDPVINELLSSWGKLPNQQDSTQNYSQFSGDFPIDNGTFTEPGTTSNRPILSVDDVSEYFQLHSQTSDHSKNNNEHEILQTKMVERPSDNLTPFVGNQRVAVDNYPSQQDNRDLAGVSLDDSLVNYNKYPILIPNSVDRQRSLSQSVSVDYPSPFQTNYPASQPLEFTQGSLQQILSAPRDARCDTLAALLVGSSVDKQSVQQSRLPAAARRDVPNGSVATAKRLKRADGNEQRVLMTQDKLTPIQSGGVSDTVSTLTAHPMPDGGVPLPTPHQIVSAAGVSDFQSGVLLAAAAHAFLPTAPEATGVGTPRNNHDRLKPSTSESLQTDPEVKPSSMNPPESPAPNAIQKTSKTGKPPILTSEQRRRFNLNVGIEALNHMMPSRAPPNYPYLEESKPPSKACTLHRAYQHVARLKKDRQDLQMKQETLRSEMKQLTELINHYQRQLPTTGIPAARGNPQSHELRQLYDSYIRGETGKNWKFFLLSVIMNPVFDSYSNSVTDATPSDFPGRVLSWLEQHCSLHSLRSHVTNSLQELSTSTSILSDPSLVPQQAKQAVLDPSPKGDVAGGRNPSEML